MASARVNGGRRPLHAADSRPAGSSLHRVVVVGGGFGGLHTVKSLRAAPVQVTLIDRNNYHLFQPLTYQVATGALSPDEIGKPLRAIFRGDPNVRVLLAEVTGFDLQARTVFMRPAHEDCPQSISYDTLVVGTGSDYSYFGHEEWRPLTIQVKTLEQALDARARVLMAFEAAELESDARARASWLTFVVIGGGSTGVEIAGQIAELARDTLPGDFRSIDPRASRVILVEREERILPSFPPSLSRRAARSLEHLGVTVLTGRTVIGIEPHGVRLQSRDSATELAPARTVVWAAGVAPSPLARSLAEAAGSEADRSGRVPVELDLTVAGHPDAIAIGDMVSVRDPDTGIPRVLPGLAPVAMQQGRYAGRLIRDRLEGRGSPPFRYRDKGSMATLGRTRAVADLHGVLIGGPVAWVLWLAVHLIYLIGFENRVIVLVRWGHNFLTHGRGARWIIRAPESTHGGGTSRTLVGAGERAND
ncbi:MAG: NAD(P)/FAD-dependent oxidoreductase [Solirubrobacteraceae bacterium]